MRKVKYCPLCGLKYVDLELKVCIICGSNLMEIEALDESKSNIYS